jgi:hypothetical protein
LLTLEALEFLLREHNYYCLAVPGQFDRFTSFYRADNFREVVTRFGNGILACHVDLEINAKLMAILTVSNSKFPSKSFHE